MNKSNRTITIIALVVAVIGLGIGFAAFSSTLTINTQASVRPDASTFKVVFSNLIDGIDTSDVVPVKSVDSITTTNGIIDNSSDSVISNLSAEFTDPGQKVEYNFYVYNAGEYVSHLNSITLKGNKSCTAGEGATAGLVTAACDDIVIKVEYDGITTSTTMTNIEGKTLNPKEGKAIKVTLEYLSNGDRVDGKFNVTFQDISMYFASVAGLNEQNRVEAPGAGTGTKMCSLQSGEAGAIGSLYSCNVGDSTRNFYVLENNDGDANATLIMDSNIDDVQVAWSYAESTLATKTSVWTNSEILDIDLPTAYQIAGVSENTENWDVTNKWSGFSVPNWLTGDYWTSTPINSDNHWIVEDEGRLHFTVTIMGQMYIRPVIVVSKSSL